MVWGCPPWVAWILAAYVKFPCMLTITDWKDGKLMGVEILYVRPFANRIVALVVSFGFAENAAARAGVSSFPPE